MSQQVIGIDLGTSNSAMAYWREGSDEVREITIPQVETSGQLAHHSSLPSFLYIPHEGESRSGDLKLPWQTREEEAVAGTWARDRGAELPERVVVSAKSWLCNSLAVRRDKILPWRSELPTTVKYSPVEASTFYLNHLKQAFQHAEPEADLASSHFIVTVPASFDEVARSLTYEAAEAAGLPDITLLEEPIAAFYAWISAQENDWRKQIQPGDLVLVCDMGGGTTDFSLIAVHEKDGALNLERISVGEHLLLGGDNMDLTLAYTLKAELEEQGHKLSQWQFLSLVNQARLAKEKILAEGDVNEVPIAVANKGSSLFAQTISTSLKREQVETILVEGFFPRGRLDEQPKNRRPMGIQEVGLNYESDPAMTRHLARFLKRSWQNIASNSDLKQLVTENLQQAPEGFLLPSAILFNGGVFKSHVIKNRIMNVLQSWSQSPIKQLEGEQLELAVAKGAAYYGKTRAQGEGIRIKAGTARSYYIGLESTMPAVPGYEPPVKGLCLVPQGTEEGSEIELKDQQFYLTVGEPGEFRFFSSATRAGDEVGTIVDDANSSLEESVSLSITLPQEEGQEGNIVPVVLDAMVTEVGTLKLFMKHIGSSKKWNLEFDVRQGG